MRKGCHVAKYLAKELRPEIFVGMDGTPLMANTNLRPDGGPCVWVKGRLACSDQGLIDVIRNATHASNQHLPYANLETPYGDASAVYNAGLAPNTVTFGHVCANTHGFGVANRKCFYQTQRILLQLGQLLTYE